MELVIRHCYYHQEGFVSENSAEQDGPLSKTVKDSGMSIPGNEDAMGHSGHADVARCGENTDIAPQGESAGVANHGGRRRAIQDEAANVTAHDEDVSATHHEGRSKVTDHDAGRVTNHGDRQSSAQEPERDDLLHCDDSFKTVPSGKNRTAPSKKSGNVQLERKPHCERPNASVTGFCLTAYVTGFGDSDHDPARRWTIGLNLLQHAIVQLNSNSHPKH